METHNPQIIKAIKNIFKKDQASDFWDDLSDEQQAEIAKASLEIKNGEVTDYDLFMKKHR